MDNTYFMDEIIYILIKKINYFIETFICFACHISINVGMENLTSQL